MRKRFIGWLAFGVPFVWALLFAGASPGWLDSAEFVAASFSLGLSHPPGHPAYLLFSHLFAMLPLASVPFRLALFSATCLGVASWLAYRIALLLLVIVRGNGTLGWHERVLSCLVVLSLALSYTCMLQGVRPEVYTLHAALMLASMERLLAAYCLVKGLLSAPSEMQPSSPENVVALFPEEREDAGGSSKASGKGFLQKWLGRSLLDDVTGSRRRTPRKLWESFLWRHGGRDLCLSAVWAGLALANHHYLTLLMVPGFLLVLTGMGWRNLVKSFALVALVALTCWGLLTYAYLPLRSVRTPAVHWGTAHTAQGLVWYVSAQAWQRSVKPTGQIQPMATRALMLASVFVEQIGWIWFLLSWLGFYLLVRLGGWAGFGVVAWWGGGVAGRLVIVVDRFDADLHGYLVVPMLLLACVIAVVISLSWEVFLAALRKWSKANPGRSLSRGWRTLAGVAVVGWLLALPVRRLANSLAVPEQFPFAVLHSDQHQARSALVWSELSEEPLPLQTLLLTSNYQTGFLRWYRTVVELHRPDIVTLPRNLLGHRAFAALEARRHPKFRALILAFAAKSPRRFAMLEKLARTQTVCLEWFGDLPPSMAQKLYPSGSMFCWLPESQRPSFVGGKASDDHSIKEQQRFFWARVYRTLEQGQPLSRDVRRVLLWAHYQHALLYSHSGRWAAGLEEVRRGLRLARHSKALKKLKQLFVSRLSSD